MHPSARAADALAGRPRASPPAVGVSASSRRQAARKPAATPGTGTTSPPIPREPPCRSRAQHQQGDRPHDGVREEGNNGDGVGKGGEWPCFMSGRGYGGCETDQPYSKAEDARQRVRRRTSKPDRAPPQRVRAGLLDALDSDGRSMFLKVS